MTIIEETESEWKSELQLWENTDGKIWFQVGYGDDEPCMTQGISLTPDDAHALINELQRLLKNIEATETPESTKQLKINLQA